MESKLRTASVVLLVLVGALVLLASVGSAWLAYFGDYPIARVSIREVAAGNEEVLTGLRGVRATSAAWGVAWAVLFLAVVLGPYRKGDVSVWWGILASTLSVGLVVGARVIFLGTQTGTGAPLLLLILVVMALLVDVKRVANALPPAGPSQAAGLPATVAAPPSAGTPSSIDTPPSA